ncbi:MAG: ABC transporter permease [Candidatus Bathyarchaeota archaeon]|nr:MAG: ABC transporter permease [Candidatus Bathyarchaeota archaeon]
MSFVRIALRNIPRRKLRNTLTVLGVVLGVSLLLGVNIAFESALAQFISTINRSSGSVDISIRSATGASFQYSVLTGIRGFEGISEASGRVSGSGRAIYWDVTEENSASLTIYGVDSGNDFDYLDAEYTNVTGSKLLKENSIVIDARLNYTIGQQIKLRVRSRYYWFEVVGLYHLPAEMRGTFFASRYTAYVDIPKAQEIFGIWGRLNRIIVRVENITETDKVVKALSDRLGGEYTVTADKQRILDRMEQNIAGFRNGLFFMSAVANAVAMVIVFNTVYMNVKERMYEIGVLRSIGASKRQVFWMFLLESGLMGLLGSAIGLVGGIGLAEFFSSLLAATFRTEEVQIIIGPEIVAVGLLAGVLTTVVGGLIPSIIAGRTGILQALRPSMRSTGHKRLHWILLIAGIPLLAIGTYIRTQVYVPDPTTLQRLGFISLPLIIGGLVLVTAGIIRSTEKIFEYILYPFLRRNSRLASRNFGRNLVRTTVSYTLIAMTLAFIIFMGGTQISVNDGIEEAVTSFFESDIIITSGGDALDREFWKKLVRLENETLIEKAAPTRIIGTQLRALTRTQNVSATVMAIHTKNGAYSDEYCGYSDVMKMTFTTDTPPDVYQRLHDLNTIVLSNDVAKTLDAKVGSRINVLSLLAVEIVPGVVIWKPVWRIFTVIGIVAEGAQATQNMPLSRMCYISYHTLNGQWGYYEDEASMFYVKVKPEYQNDIGYVRDKILEKFGRRYGIGVITRVDVLDAIKGNIQQIWGLFYAIILFSVAIAAIGMSSIMIMNISERRREIGIMRSQGMSKLQVGTMIIGEATILGVIGLVLGIISGLVFYQGVVFAMTQTGFSVPFTIPYDSIRTSTFLAIGVSIVSVLYPVYKANKMNIVEALRGE